MLAFVAYTAEQVRRLHRIERNEFGEWFPSFGDDKRQPCLGDFSRISRQWALKYEADTFFTVSAMCCLFLVCIKPDNLFDDGVGVADEQLLVLQDKMGLGA